MPTIPSLLGSYIDQTYQRLVQVSGSSYADGLGNPITFSSAFPYTGSAGITGSLVITGSTTSTLGFTGSLQGTASWANNAITSSRPINTLGTTLYSTNPVAGPGFSTNNNIFLGNETAAASNTSDSNFLGYRAGYSASNASFSNFFGQQAGIYARGALNSNFIGNSVGSNATNASDSNFFGSSAGSNATNAFNSNFFGKAAGFGANNASYSTLIGFKAGNLAATNQTIGTNNIIIGTNISLAPNRQNSINIGGIIFGTGSYSTITDLDENAFTGSANGKIGINIITPTRNFEVSGSVAFNNLTNALYPNVLSVDTSTGQLYYQSALSGSGGGSVIVAYTGSTVDFAATVLDFTGSGVIVTGGAGTSTIEIPGSRGGTPSNGLASNGGGSHQVVLIDPTVYRYCSIEYYVNMQDGTPTIYASRSGKVTVNIPYNYNTTTAKFPIIDESTEYYIKPDDLNATTEDVKFVIDWTGTKVRIKVINDNPTYNADFHSTYTLI